MEKNTLDDQLEMMRAYLNAQVSTESERLKKALECKAAANIAIIRNKAEESIGEAVRRYEIELTKADAMAKNPATTYLAEIMRTSAKRQMDNTIDFHKTIAQDSIQAIKNLLR